MSETGPVYGVELIDTLPQAMPSRADLEGVKGYRQGHRVVAAYEVLLSHWREQADEIERLRAIVGKLPTTADGVPVVRGMMLYDPTTIEYPFEVRELLAYCPDAHRSEWACDDGEIDVSQCYSTRAAAEAAKGKS